MADPNYIAPSEGEKDKADKPDIKSEDWKTIEGMDKFKSEADLAKAYKELETKLGKNSEELSKNRQFAETIAPVLDIIKNDPEAFKLIDEKLRGVDSSKEDRPKSDKKDKKDEELRQVASDILIKNFESKHGFNDLSPDEQSNLRGKIGNFVKEMTGQNLTDVDLRRLDSVMENAYVLATQDSKRTDQEEETEPNGAISSLPSSKSKSSPKITPDEAKVASKLGLTTEQYLSGKKVN